MKIVLVQERGKVRILENNSKEKKTVEGAALNLRSRLTGGEVMYYELDYKEREGTSLEAYVEAINKYPSLLETSNLIKRI